MRSPTTYAGISFQCSITVVCMSLATSEAYSKVHGFLGTWGGYKTLSFPAYREEALGDTPIPASRQIPVCCLSRSTSSLFGKGAICELSLISLKPVPCCWSATCDTSAKPFVSVSNALGFVVYLHKSVGMSMSENVCTTGHSLLSEGVGT